jgi:hypothetical protein
MNQAINKTLLRNEFSAVMIVFSGFVLGLYYLYDTNKDMERYYIYNDKLKYTLLLYCKYVLMFAFVYNLKFLLFKMLFGKT